MKTRGSVASVKSPLPFPTDMLRYDRCYPATERDAIALAHIIQSNTGGWVLKLAKVGKDWTTERWASFGCMVEIVVS